ncbi:aldo/keto reductase [Prochlorococcus sp. MIT 1223]|uniref:aldo/keto reductase n=1 Tax=Prochlorococcus sp. MIT 1223 TaxID=3096217 RepID=UPI002A74919E|nr:aldo/keto reductase [Prochlorococcus sp. MIT 1223]
MSFNRRSFGPNSQVSLFTLGTMRAIESSQQMYKVLESAIAAGINHIETAPAYGPAEDFLGDSIQRLKLKNKLPEGGLIVTSKIQPGISFDEGKSEIKNILSRLRISKIDNLAVHGINLNEHLEWALNGEGADLLTWAQQENLIDQIGFSSHGSIPLIQKAINSNRFVFCSLHLHLLDPQRIPLAKLAIKQGMGVMAISPADKGGQLQNPSQMLIEDCKPIPPIELAYRYLIAQGISTLTVGASKTEDLRLPQKLSSADGPLSQEEQRSIERLNSIRRTRLGNDFCGQCKACLPCPKQIPIPEILRLRNLTVGHDLQAFAKERYNLINKAGHWWETVDASACNNCGDCLPRCPYHLEIPDLLKDIHLKLIDKPRRRLWD